jgi:hypothetical protein
MTRVEVAQIYEHSHRNSLHHSHHTSHAWQLNASHITSHITSHRNSFIALHLLASHVIAEFICVCLQSMISLMISLMKQNIKFDSLSSADHETALLRKQLVE